MLLVLKYFLNSNGTKTYKAKSKILCFDFLAYPASHSQVITMVNTFLCVLQDTFCGNKAHTDIFIHMVLYATFHTMPSPLDFILEIFSISTHFLPRSF